VNVFFAVSLPAGHLIGTTNNVSQLCENNTLGDSDNFSRSSFCSVFFGENIAFIDRTLEGTEEPRTHIYCLSQTAHLIVKGDSISKFPEEFRSPSQPNFASELRS
jgi:hypothetical protein